MEKYTGKSILKGIAIGKICFYSKGELQVKRTSVEDTQHELDRFEKAKEDTIGQLHALYEKALKEVGEANHYQPAWKARRSGNGGRTRHYRG